MSIEEIFHTLSEPQKKAVLKLNEVGGDISTLTGAEINLKREISEALKIAASRGLGSLDMVRRNFQRVCGEDIDDYIAKNADHIVSSLGEKRTPTPLRYNDFALIFATAQCVGSDLTFDAEYLSEYLISNPFVPRMIQDVSSDLKPSVVSDYLEELNGSMLVSRKGAGYSMDSRVASNLKSNMLELKCKTTHPYLIIGIHSYVTSRL